MIHLHVTRNIACLAAGGLILLVLSGWPKNGFPQGAGERDPVSASSPYLSELTARAVSLRLWERRFWHLLMHYKSAGLWGGVESEADGPGFFLSPEGKTDPRQELEATLAAFFSTDAIKPADMTPQCTFPARYRWLDEQLDFDESRLPPQPCERFETWRRRIDPESVSLIFSSYYFNNPASMFGHTLLRFNKRGRSEQARLLDNAVNFSANVPEGDGALTFAIFGLTGGYRGYFSMLPYYLKVKEYNDLESRDLWEYKLNLSPDRLDYMVRHTWEMGSTYFDYYFFKENCSYHLLSLLEIGDPELRLTDAYWAFTMPGDTIKQVVAAPGLVAEVTYRPSLGSQFAQKALAMEDEERARLGAVLENPDVMSTPDYQAMPEPRRVLLVDTAIDYFQYKLAGRPEGEDERKSKLRRLSIMRSRMEAGEKRTYPAVTTPVEAGHNTSWVSVALGATPMARADGDTEYHGFAELSVQPAYHHLLSADAGYAPGSQIDLGHLRLRYEQEPKEWRLERFMVADVVSLTPLTTVVRQPSWKIGIGWQRNRDIGCEQCTPFFLNPGIGASLSSAVFSREVYFAMLDARYEYDRELTDHHRAGFGLSLGMMVDFVDGWRVGLFGSRTRYTEGWRGYVNRASLMQRISLSRNWELLLEWRGVEDYREAKLGLGVYF